MKPNVALVFGLLFLLSAPLRLQGEPTSEATTFFNSYCMAVEYRLTRQHGSTNTFLAPVSPDGESRLRRGRFVTENLAPSLDADLPGAMLHHWRATAFVPGARAADFERLLRDFNSYPQYFAPQVLRSSVIAQGRNRMRARVRVRQQHGITVVLDTTYDVAFGQLDARHGFSISRSERIDEIDAAGTRTEHALTAHEERGFLWSQNTYWSYEEQDGGLSLQIEAVSLSRSIPIGLGWVVRPYVESIPRESLEFTLRSVCNAIRK
jgi:hypothetical protein